MRVRTAAVSAVLLAVITVVWLWVVPGWARPVWVMPVFITALVVSVVAAGLAVRVRRAAKAAVSGQGAGPERYGLALRTVPIIVVMAIYIIAVFRIVVSGIDLVAAGNVGPDPAHTNATVVENKESSRDCWALVTYAVGGTTHRSRVSDCHVSVGVALAYNSTDPRQAMTVRGWRAVASGTVPNLVAGWLLLTVAGTVGVMLAADVRWRRFADLRPSSQIVSVRARRSGRRRETIDWVVTFDDGKHAAYGNDPDLCHALDERIATYDPSVITPADRELLRTSAKSGLGWTN